MMVVRVLYLSVSIVVGMVVVVVLVGFIEVLMLMIGYLW